MKKENTFGETPIYSNPLGDNPVIVPNGGLDRFMDMPTEWDIDRAIERGDVEAADAMRCVLAVEDAL